MEFFNALDTFIYSPMDQLLDIDAEKWKIINDYPNYYVSTQGRVKNNKTGRILKPGNSRGYPKVTLCQNGVPKDVKVHRLVALVFLPNPENKPCIDHMDGNKTNNTVINLRWVTYSENNMNTQKQVNCSSIFKGVNFRKDRQKYQARIKFDGKINHLGYYDSQEEAAKVYNEAAIKYFGQFARVNIIK